MRSLTETEMPWLKGLSLAGVAALALTACGGGEETAEESGLDLVNAGALTVCADFPYAPFEYYDEDGNEVGLDIDIAQAIADDLELELEIMQTAFEGIQSGVALNANQCDLAISGMTITEARAGNMLFSDPYLDDNLSVLARSDSGIETLEDLEGFEGTVGAQSDTTGAVEAGERGLDLREYTDAGLMLQGLESGQVDAAFGNISILAYQAAQSDDLVFVDEIETGEQLGIAAQLENQELIDAVNQVLADLEASGKLEELKEFWLHSDEAPDEADDEDDN
ncbi:ABC transporter substrate-binding protein [Nesterenkonia massiliensis]|uniref:ABC transporter substrate-binding protein n=1 Tax=Nesterenkonia massiliensis TaxID=1232429 RepID=A0ABT2HNV4_9MICC|nr:ABC transporter substrate-binding protein [Nesterenkonia massiliensis]MCT1606361.1 ABC transporter substrate-binding protein [Nesterenkonia massiliensis]